MRTPLTLCCISQYGTPLSLITRQYSNIQPCFSIIGVTSCPALHSARRSTMGSDSPFISISLQLGFCFSMEKQWKNKGKCFFVSRSWKREGKVLCFSRGHSLFLCFSTILPWKNEILVAVSLPDNLDPSILKFLSLATELDHVLVAKLWEVLRNDLPSLVQQSRASISVDDAFRLFASPKEKISTSWLPLLSSDLNHRLFAGSETLRPPFSSCIHSDCPKFQKPLTESESSHYEARIFTLTRGVLPAISSSLYCRRKSIFYESVINNQIHVSVNGSLQNPISS